MPFRPFATDWGGSFDSSYEGYESRRKELTKVRFFCHSKVLNRDVFLYAQAVREARYTR